MKKIFMWLCISVYILGSISTAESALYGTTIDVNGTISQLVEINPSTGALMNTIGSVGYAVNGLTYDITTGKLYGSTSFNDPTYNGLIEINMTTGAGTPVGTSGWGFGGTNAVTNITVNSTGSMFGWLEGDDDLVSINKATGIATLVGDSGLSTQTNGLSFNSSDVLYMVNWGGNVYIVNTSTGAVTYINTIGVTAHHGDFNPANGLWYGIDTNSAQSDSRSLVLANFSTWGTTTLPTVDRLHTLQFVPAAPVPIPAAVWLLGSGLIGLIGIRRFRK